MAALRHTRPAVQVGPAPVGRRVFRYLQFRNSRPATSWGNQFPGTPGVWDLPTGQMQEPENSGIRGSIRHPGGRPVFRCRYACRGRSADRPVSALDLNCPAVHPSRICLGRAFTRAGERRQTQPLPLSTR